MKRLCALAATLLTACFDLSREPYGREGERCFSDGTCTGALSCDAARMCVACTSDVAQRCEGGNIVTVDSCGRSGALFTHCGGLGCLTESNACIRPTWRDLGRIDTDITDVAATRDWGAFIVIASDDEQNETETDIYVRRIDYNGAVSEPLPGSASAGGINASPEFPSRPAISQSPSGTIYVGWMSNFVGTDDDGNQLHIPRFTSLAGGAWRELYCDDPVPGGLSRATIAAADPAVYLSWATLEGTSRIWRWDSGTCVSISDPTTGWRETSYVRSLKVSARGTLFAGGSLDTQELERVRPFVSRYDGSIWRDMVFDDPRFSEISTHAFSVSKDDDIVLVVQDNGYGDGDIFAFQWQGDSWIQLGENISNSESLSRDPAVIADDWGYPVVIWTEGPFATGIALVRRWNGNAWIGYGSSGADFSRLSSTSEGGVSKPSIVFTDYGLAAVWNEFGGGIRILQAPW